MKLKNTTDYPNHFLRRMISWICTQHGLPVRYVQQASFGNKTDASSGRAWGYSRRMHVSLIRSESLASPQYRTNVLVSITAHELFHLYAHYAKIRTRGNRHEVGSSEKQTRFHEARVLHLFLADRENLLRQWLAKPKRKERPKKSLQEKRAVAVDAKLVQWERKLKTAQRKVREYRKKKRYYNKAIAAKKAS